MVRSPDRLTLAETAIGNGEKTAILNEQSHPPATPSAL